MYSDNRHNGMTVAVHIPGKGDMAMEGEGEEDINMAKTKKKAAKVRKSRKANGNGAGTSTSELGAGNRVMMVKPAPKDGPNLTLRMRDATSIARIKQAAIKAGMSMNTWAVEVLGQAAEAQ
jgi:hypothetical protein